MLLPRFRGEKLFFSMEILLARMVDSGGSFCQSNDNLVFHNEQLFVKHLGCAGGTQMQHMMKFVLCRLRPCTRVSRHLHFC